MTLRRRCGVLRTTIWVVKAAAEEGVEFREVGVAAVLGLLMVGGCDPLNDERKGQKARVGRRGRDL